MTGAQLNLTVAIACLIGLLLNMSPEARRSLAYFALMVPLTAAFTVLFVLGVVAGLARFSAKKLPRRLKCRN